ncbi:MAG: methyl-accepting chemotaxis protein [Melioribacteraceae bacterium]
MKNLFSAYNNSSIKTTLTHRFALIGVLTLLLLVLGTIKLNQVETERDNFKNQYSELLQNSDGGGNDIQELTTQSNMLLTISMWSVFGLLFLSVVFIPIQISKYITSSIEQISLHVKELTNGSFVKRTTNIKQKDEFGTISWDLNDATDQMESLLKEVGTTIDYVTAKKYFRPTMSAGMNGTYSVTAERVDKALKTQSADLIKEKEYLESNTEKILEVMELFANGDLTVNLVPKNKDDIIGRLFLGFNKAVKNITDIVNVLRETIQSTTAASLDISASSEEMASNAQEQSSQTLDITSAIEEMTKTIIATTENSTNAAVSAEEAGTLAVEGGKVVSASVVGMEKVAAIVEDAAVKVTELGKNNEQIGGIIGVINDIADQTNLLALNAAIEAARAGEHGRGFAVVADEVRKLSQRTTQATQEISSVIQNIQGDVNKVVQSINSGNKEVQEGKELSQKVEQVMSNFIESINVVTDNINQVATAGEEQSSAAEQVGQNIAIINNVSSESAIGLQQIANATTDLEHLIETLNGAIANFTTGENSQNIGNKNLNEHNYQEQNQMVII